MAIFRRRVIQQELDFLRRGVVPPERARDLIQRLNGSRPQAIPAEWEVVLLASLARVASVKYERAFNAVRLDFFVRGEGVEFAGDIVAISDVDIAKRNPAEFFFRECGRIAATFGFDNGGFDIRIADRTTGKYPDKRTELLLPVKGDIPQFLGRELRPFFQQIRSDPGEVHVLRCVQPGIKFRITFDPKLLGSTTGRYASAAAPMSLRRNPL
ncbi:MAG TPA: hypothetical protein VH207_05395, partial [Chthoniobacterales bacterium]|nr:hypothetical protein [Chthoniobacterales bacterium]